MNNNNYASDLSSALSLTFISVDGDSVTDFELLISISSPVAGFRPFLAALTLCLKVPSLATRICTPLSKTFDLIISTASDTI